MKFVALPLGSSWRWKLVPAIAFVVLGDWLVYQRGLSGGALGVLALALLAAMLAARPAVRRSPAAWAALCVATIFGLALAWDPGLLSWNLFWLAAGMAALLPQVRAFGDGWRWAQRLAWQGLSAPLRPLLDLARLAKVRRAGRGRANGLRAAVALLGLPLIGGTVIVALFCAANPILERALSSLLSIDDTFTTLGRSLLWSLLFTMVWSLLRPRLLKNPLPLFEGRGDSSLPGASTASVTLSLVVFNAIFALQNLLDAAYLWGFAELPKGMTLADYAHRGAYPLIATALLAALFVLVALRPGSQTAGSGKVRALVTLWIAQNIFLVASSIQRTMDYVEAYSLTRLRIAALAWMVLVAFGLATICWRLLRDRSSAWLVNVNLAAAALLLTVSCFVNFGTVAAGWNVRHAREVGGEGAALDLCYLDQLGDSALLPLLELEQRPELAPGFRERVQAVRLRASQDRSSALGLVHAERMEQAQAVLAGMPPARVMPGPRKCDGSLIPPREPAAAVTAAPPIVVQKSAPPATRVDRNVR